MPIMAKDLVTSETRVEVLKAREVAAGVRNETAALKAKVWDQVTPAEKDRILKAIAINLGLVAPDAEMIPRTIAAKSRTAK